MHGRYPGTVTVDGNKLIVDGKPIIISNELDPTKIRWGEAGADYVLESTGKDALRCPVCLPAVDVRLTRLMG